jgi:hypothetical protein
MRRIRPKPNENHHNFAPNQHRPTLEEQMTSPDKIGLKVAHIGVAASMVHAHPWWLALGPTLLGGELWAREVGCMCLMVN